MNGSVNNKLSGDIMNSWATMIWALELRNQELFGGTLNCEWIWLATWWITPCYTADLLIGELVPVSTVHNYNQWIPWITISQQWNIYTHDWCSFDTFAWDIQSVKMLVKSQPKRQSMQRCKQFMLIETCATRGMCPWWSRVWASFG